MVKMLVLAGWYGLSDYEVELLATDRLSFRHFLGYPETGIRPSVKSAAMGI